MDTPNAVSGFWAAMTALVVIATQILQSWWHQYQQNKAAEKLATTTKEEAKKIAVKADATASKVDSVYQAVNGEGVSGKLSEIVQWQETHEKNDVKRFQEMHEFLKQFSPINNSARK
jgi:crotonobetainyl-CoA:carnitine CoA-transferase CaiB-like acyl-CoA transferase